MLLRMVKLSISTFLVVKVMNLSNQLVSLIDMLKMQQLVLVSLK
jgi:hypothetical protein